MKGDRVMLVLLLLLVLPLVDATYYSDSTGLAGAAPVGDTGMYGVNIMTNIINNSLVSATKYATDASTIAYLYHPNGTKIAQANFSGDIANFTGLPELSIGVNYSVRADKGGASRNVVCTSANWGGPIVGNGINFTGVYNGCASPTKPGSIVSIQTMNFTPSTPNATLNPPSWVSPTPADGVTNNTQVTLNASGTDPGITYFIWFDTNPDPTTLVVNNASTGNYTTSVPGTTTTYYYKAAVWNATGGFSDNTSVRNWTFDAVNPSITLNPNNEFNVRNYSLRNPFDGLVHLNITFADDHDLYGMSVNITRGGTVYFNLSNETLGGTSYVYAQTVNSSTWGAGVYNVELFVSDSHTVGAISDYQVTKKKSSISFKPGDDNNIKIETRESSTITATKEVDRYTFNVVFDDGTKKARLFDVKTDKCPLTYKPTSGFKGHFVSSCGRGGNWVDFEGVAGTPQVTRIDDFHYTVYFDSLDPSVTFRSIGGLNVLSINYSFYQGNYTTFSESPIATGEEGSFGLNISTYASILNISSVFAYNGSSYFPSVANSSSEYDFALNVTSPSAAINLTPYWTVTVTQGDGNFTVFNITVVQQVLSWTLTGCGSPVFINWTQYDEDNPQTKLTGTFAVEIEYWVGNRSNAKLFNSSFPSATSWAVCFSPANGTFYANIYAQNTVPDSFTHRFYVQNGTYTNVTTYYNVYNANGSNDALYSDLKITTRNELSYAYFVNVFAQLQRRYVGEGVWRTVQYDKSGDFGLIFFDVKEQSVDYRIRYLDENNTLLLQTDSLKFVCASTVCELTQLLDPQGSSVSNVVVSNWSFDNSTGILTIDWETDATVDTTVDIQVTKQLSTGNTVVCSTSQTGVAGSFECNATGYTGELFVEFDANGEPSNGGYVSIGRVSIGAYMSGALQALVTLLLMVTIMAFGLFSPMALVITTLIGLVVVFFLGTFTPLTVTFLLVAAVLGFVISIKVKQ